MARTIDYASRGPLTDLGGVEPALLDHLGTEPDEICRHVHGLVLQPGYAETIGIPAERMAEKNLRPAGAIVEALLRLDRSALHVSREAERRVVGTCRHFAVLSCALLRYSGIPARVRCGFATYFQPGQGLDHWITEFRDDNSGRWVRIDSEILGQPVLSRPEDLEPGQFLSGGEAWVAFREGAIDARRFGVCGSENWGPAEIRGNAVKDLAALNKVEMLPWDEWGQMTASYAGETGEEYDRLIDTIAAVCAAGDPSAIADLYESGDLRVPADLMC